MEHDNEPAMTKTSDRPVLKVTTYNIHKGFSQFNRRIAVHDLRDRLRALGSDVVFLQEVQGLHIGHAQKHADWPLVPQHEFLAEDVWRDLAYGRTALYELGHHGNALLSRFPIVTSHNQDVTHLRFDPRTLLHCALDVPHLAQPLHCVCVHLSLFGHSRRRQLDALASRIELLVPKTAPLIIAGDFNDWRNRADDLLAKRLGMEEVFGCAAGRPSRSFPCALPVLRLDRIYVRGLEIDSREVHFGPPWSTISDHAALTAQLLLR
jgi:endonuclease/exonuclease/phosphatase family metal-dependent hydrolase